MQNSLRGFAAILLLVWTLLCIGAWYYSTLHDIPTRVLTRALPAFLVEAGLYLAAGMPVTRKLIERVGSPRRIALVLVTSALVPYLIYSLGTGLFRLQAFAMLAGLAGLVSCWYLFAKPNSLSDVALLAFMAAVYIANVFPWIYPDPAPYVTAMVLGRLMWIRVGILSILCIRRMGGIGFGLAPTRREWGVGFRNFLYFLPLGLTPAILLHFVKPQIVPINAKIIAIALATFLGTLWVLAAMEEFFFRGVLQQLLTRKLKSAALGVLATSLLFGSAHLWYRAFPNWRFAALAAIAGLFYGRAFVQTGSVRASMVTHALVVTTWRVFLA
jgi:membrane protease YdiL (CAAX protease family)